MPCAKSCDGQKADAGNKMNLKHVKKVSTSYPLDNKWIRVRMDCYQFSKGVGEFYTVEGPPYTMVCALTPDNNIVFVQQYRHTTQKEHLELPAGRIEEGEQPLASARREFEEETGFKLTELYALGAMDAQPGRTNLKGHLFAGRANNEKKPQTLDESESVSVVQIPIPEVLRMIRSSELPCLHSVATILLAKEKFPEWFKE